MPQFKTLIFAILFMLMTVQLFAASVEIRVNDLDIESGFIVVAVCKNQDQFQDIESYEKSIIVPAVRSTTFIRLNLPAGEYSIKVFHDENSNNEFDKNLFGVPKEKYGFSNNATGPLGTPPEYFRSIVKIRNDSKNIININLRG